jgi:hypothetical protein
LESSGFIVGVDNHRAHQLYQRDGYQIAGEPYDDCWSFVDAQGNSIEVCERIVDLVKEILKRILQRKNAGILMNSGVLFLRRSLTLSATAAPDFFQPEMPGE